VPSTITHSYMAKDIYDNLNEKVKSIFNDKLSDYITYSQGTDILFFYPFIPFVLKANKIRNLGKRVHKEKVNEFFISLIEEVKKDKNIDKFIYLSGMITHYVGDSLCHPLINYLHEKLKLENQKKKNYHFKIEAYIDNYILNLKNNSYKNFKCYNLIKAKKNQSIKNLLDNTYFKVFKEKNMGNNYYKSLYNMYFLFYLIRYDPYGIKKVFYDIIHFLMPFLKKDIRYFSYNFDLSLSESNLYLNLDKKNWYNPKKTTIKRNESFLELYDKAITKGTYMIEKLYDYIYEEQNLDLDSFLGNLSYSSGLPIK